MEAGFPPGTARCLGGGSSSLGGGDCAFTDIKKQQPDTIQLQATAVWLDLNQTNVHYHHRQAESKTVLQVEQIHWLLCQLILSHTE